MTIKTKRNLSTVDSLSKELKRISDLGFVKTHRSGNTGIGKTLEDLLGIEENNFALPDVGFAELKSARNSKNSMLTLFTKSPDENAANGRLLVNYGYPTDKGLELHATLNSKDYINLKGKKFLKIDFDDDGLLFSHFYDGPIKYTKYSYDTLINAFKNKYSTGALVYVLAENRGSKENEEFWFNEAYLFEGFNTQKFIDMLKNGDILIDIRLGVYDDGRTHDHGTGFRIQPNRIKDCFTKVTKLL